MRKIDLIVIHCSATDYDGQSAEWIRKDHMKPKCDGGRGFSDIGYHFFINQSGLIEPGRSMAIPGAHAYPKNANSLGLCLAGKKTFHKVQFKSLRLLLGLLRSHEWIKNAKVVAHNKINTGKTCPNFDVSEFATFWDSGDWLSSR